MFKLTTENNINYYDFDVIGNFKKKVSKVFLFKKLTIKEKFKTFI